MHKLRNLKSIPRTTMLWQACARSIASGRGIHIRPVIPLKYTSMVSSVHRKRSTSSWGGSWYMAHVQGSVDRYFNNSKHDIQDHITNKPRNSHWLVPETLHRGATGKQQLCQTLCLQLVQIMPWCIEKKHCSSLQGVAVPATCGNIIHSTVLDMFYYTTLTRNDLILKVFFRSNSNILVVFLNLCDCHCMFATMIATTFWQSHKGSSVVTCACKQATVSSIEKNADMLLPCCHLV